VTGEPKLGLVHWAGVVCIGSGLYLAATAPTWQEGLRYALKSLALVTLVIVARRLLRRVQ
jgi:hypothetical protein